MSVTVRPAAFVPFPRAAIDQSLVARFEEQVARHGHRTAILTPHEAWSYHELEHRASTIARSIVSHLGPGCEPVVLCLDQSASLVAAILGVLKAGKFYVPLEPSDPVARRREIVNVTGARLVIDDDFVAAWAHGPLDLRGVAPAPETPVSRATEVVIRPTDPAYVFFTSGTTGTPKGVVDCHRNVLHNIYRYTNALSIAPDDRLTVIQSASFSGTVSSMFCALLNGATLLPFDFRRNGFNRLAAWVKEARATVYHSVPSIFRGLVEAGGKFTDVRVVRLEGDGATRVDYQLFQTAFSPDCILAHGLGATETGLSCQFQLRANASWDGERLPVGRPLPDVDVRVVGCGDVGAEDGAPVPNGTVGEIEIVSEFLATGYWRDPERTTARFIAVGGPTLQRAFRTGDLGMLDDDGCVHHRGRVNQEERINGHWVSTPEIEAALRRLGVCRDVLVTTWTGAAGSARLVAYVVLREGAAVDAPRWRAALSAELPAFMIPTAFVALDAFPLGEHGKVDRRALLAPDRRDGAPPAQPLSAAEREMVSCWEQALGVTPIGTRDSFFDLGGDSLHAALLVAQVERVFGRAVPPEALITAPTVEALLRALDGAPIGASQSSPNVPAATPPGRVPLFAHRAHGPGRPFFCIDAPACAGWEMAALAHRLSPDQPFYAILSAGAVEPWPSGTTIESLADGVVGLIRTIQPSGPVMLGGHCYGAIVALEAARRLHARGEAVEVLALFDISPKDFPTLVPNGATRRYLRDLSRRQRALWRARLVQDGWRRVPRTIFEKSWRRTSTSCAALVDRVRSARSSGHPTLAAAAVAMREHVLRGYQPQRYEGEVVVFLPEATVHRYTNDPPTCWSALADRVVLHLIPGGEEAFFADPALAEIATRLREHLATVHDRGAGGISEGARAAGRAIDR